MRIGEVASIAGVGVDTIRYYERLGLLPAASRRASGYREFDHATVERIHLVKELQGLGLTLEEVGELLAAAERGGSTCPTEATRLEIVLRRTDEKIAVLTSAREQLERALARCNGGECDLLERARETKQPRRRG